MKFFELFQLNDLCFLTEAPIIRWKKLPALNWWHNIQFWLFFYHFKLLEILVHKYTYKETKKKCPLKLGNSLWQCWLSDLYICVRIRKSVNMEVRLQAWRFISNDSSLTNNFRQNRTQIQHFFLHNFFSISGPLRIFACFATILHKKKNNILCCCHSSQIFYRLHHCQGRIVLLAALSAV